MTSRPARLLCPALLALSTAFCLPAQAVPPIASATPARSYGQAVTQADGITSRILDNLSVATDQYFHDGDYNRVIGLSRIAVEADPNYNDGYENMGYLLWSQGYTPAADAILQYGLSRTNNKAGLAFEFGRHLYTTQRYTQAEPYLIQSVSYANAQPMFYAMLGHCYEKNGKLTEAVQAWQTLVQKFPGFASGPPNLKRALALQNKK